MIRRLGVLAGLILVFAIPNAHAAQGGRVTSDTAEVHQFPNVSSPLLSTLTKDTSIPLSSDLVHDLHGEYWYKVRIPQGGLGYIRAKDVKAFELDRSLKRAGMDTPLQHTQERERDAIPWTFVIRAMGVGGYETTTKTVEFGGEGEFSVCLFPFSHGYLHRMLSLGVAAQALTTDTAVMASLIYRIFSEGRVEPEFRLRVGDGLTSQSIVAGANFGVRYPFSLDSGSQLSGYLEGGVLGSLSANAPIHIFASAGIGFHI